MPFSPFPRYYTRTDFAALSGPVPIPLLTSSLRLLTLTLPVRDVRATLDGAVVEWESLPPQADINAVDAAVAAFTGGATTAEPFELESLGVTNEAAGALVDKIDFTTPGLDAGTYQVLWAALVGMLATVTNAGVRGLITLTRMNGDGSGAVSRPWEHNWNLQQPQTFSGGITFKCTAGQKIRARLQVQKVGAAATAQMASARITIDQISPG